MSKVKKKTVAIVMGSLSDFKTMREAQRSLKFFSIPFETKIVSAHRTPEKLMSFAQESAEYHTVIIAGAGGAAHLPGMIAALSSLPVIGVPVTQTKVNGLDAILSILQMPKGVPVATVALDSAFNAGILAAQIMAINDAGLSNKIKNYKKGLKSKVAKMNGKLKSIKKSKPGF
jgi:5-(carboxyamino)imidazole ribonucleotide mutase